MHTVDITNLPLRMRDLPTDERGYPIPWFADHIEGVTQYKTENLGRWLKAAREGKCWACGETLGIYKVFMATPECGISKVAPYPACHADCATWCAKNCPQFGADAVTMLWFCRDYTVVRPVFTYLKMKKPAAIVMGEPTGVHWYYRGEPATRDQVLKSLVGVEETSKLGRWLPPEVDAVNEVEETVSIVPKLVWNTGEEI